MGDSTNRPSVSGRSILELDHVFNALAHPRRRYLVYTLQADEQWTLEELGSKIAHWERDGSEPDRDAVVNVRISLYHNHIPKLVEDDIVEFDERTETIQKGPNADQVLHVLEYAGMSSDSRLEAHARGRTNEGYG